ncbi:MAG: hypothetical protein PVS2B1_22160 [Candidatus Dormibacteraceae bacterium]
MDSGIFGESQPPYRRLLLMVLGETIAGTLLYAAFKLMPALQTLIAVASWAIVVNENLTFPENKSLGGESGRR